MSSPRGAEIADYARRVRAELADLPAAQLDELLEDLEQHLAEVALENDAPLEFRLGSPAAYAAELREASGLGAEPEPAPAQVPLAERVTALVATARASQPVREVQAFLPELRPAWWVLRPWLALLAVDSVLFGSPSFPVPDFGLGFLPGVVLTGAAVVWSVRLGRAERRRPADARRRRLLIAGNAVLALLAIGVVVSLSSSAEPAQAEYTDYGGPVFSGGGTLQHEDGSPITNIQPYGPDGQPLEGVLLYDQDGRPIDNLAEATVDGLPVERVVPTDGPPAPSNAYPQEQRTTTYDQYGQPVPEPSSPTLSTPDLPTVPEPTDAGVGSTEGAPEPAPSEPAPEPVPAPAPEPVPAPATP